MTSLPINTFRARRGHTLIELMAATIASAFLLAGLGSVMYIARQVAYTPSDSIQRSSAAMVVNQICDELRYATLVLQQTPQILEFVVADRNSDGTAEKIRYQWSGTPGDPLVKTINGGTGVNVLPSVQFLRRYLAANSKNNDLHHHERLGGNGSACQHHRSERIVSAIST